MLASHSLRCAQRKDGDIRRREAARKGKEPSPDERAEERKKSERRGLSQEIERG